MANTLSSCGIVEGETYTSEKLAELVPAYPDGRRPRPRAVVRRLAPMLQLVERGPNGSLSRGATYRIVVPPPVPDEDPSEKLATDDDWLMQAVEKMTTPK